MPLCYNGLDSARVVYTKDVEMGLFKSNVNKMRVKRDVEGLLRTLAIKDELTRVQAIKALAEIKDVVTMEPLTRLCKDDNENVSVRIAAVQALGSIGDTACVEFSIGLLMDKNENADVRVAAAHTLGEIGDTRAIQPLIRTLKDRNWSVRWAVMSPLTKMGAEAVESLITALRNEDNGIRQKAAWVLGGIGDTRAVEPLIVCLRDKNESVREAVDRALKKLGYKASPIKPDRKITRGKHRSVTLRCQECGFPLVHAYENRFCCDNPKCSLLDHIVT